MMSSSERLLVHICCYPCLDVSLPAIKKFGFGFDGFFFNPNIHPYAEYKKRLSTLKTNAGEISFQEGDYPYREFIRRTLDLEGEKRCGECYRIRFTELVKKAVSAKYHFVTTTLFSSPYQKNRLIKEVLSEIAAASGLEALSFQADPEYRAKVRFLSEKQVYTQNYCGCIFSNYERSREFRKKTTG